jgi:GPH family glycoside/pentoside/hexuronide:cation symporter
MPQRTGRFVSQIPFSVKAGWGVGAFGSLGMLWMVNVFLMFFLVNHLGVSPALAGIILFITRIYDVITDPLVGHLSDNTRSRWGRRRLWMLVGALVSGLSAILVFNVPPLGSENALAAYELVILIAYFTGFTLFYVPFMAMPSDMTNDYNERTSIMSFRVAYSFAAGIIIAAGMPALISTLGGGRAAYETTSIIAGLLIAMSMLMTVYFTRGAPVIPLGPRHRYTIREYFSSLMRNRPFLSLAALKFIVFLSAGVNGGATMFYMTYVMDRGEMGLAFLTLMSNVAGLCALPLWTRFSYGRDKRWFWLVAMLGTALLQLSWAYAPADESDLVFGLRGFLLGAFGAGGLVMGFSMLPDTIEYDRITTGLDRAGLYTGLLGFIEKNAAAVGPLIIGMLFNGVGLVGGRAGGQVQSPEAISAIIAAKAWIPAALLLVGAALLLTYRLDAKRLATLRAEAAGATGVKVAASTQAEGSAVAHPVSGAASHD